MHPFATEGWPQRHIHYRNSVGVPLPVDTTELTETYGPMLMGLLTNTGRSLDDLVAGLGSVLEGFDYTKFLPQVIDCNAVWDLLGCTYGSWCGMFPARVKAGWWLPIPVGATEPTASVKVKYHARDIVQLRNEPKSPGRLQWPNRPLYPASTVQAFEDYLRASAEKVISTWVVKAAPKSDPVPAPTAKKPKAEVSCVGWPIGVPKDYTAFYKEYRGYVEKVLNRYVRPMSGQSIEDIKQHVWMKLVESKVIEKFVEKARRRKIPATLTAAEVVDFLGISWDQWFGLMKRDLKWLVPVEGETFSTRAVFTKIQIRNIEESGYVPIKDAIPASDMTKVFKGYLAQVIHNHFANYCRTRTRREILDTVLPENARVVGGHVGSALEGDSTPWEESLEDTRSLPPDFGLDAPKGFVLGDRGLDGTEELFDYLADGVARIDRMVHGRQNDVFALIEDGYLLTEAIRKVQTQIAEERVRSAAVG